MNTPATPPPRKRHRHRTSAAELRLDARAREQIVLAWGKLTGTHGYSLNSAARTLGLSPSMFSGLNSLPGRYLRGGVRALQLPYRARPSLISHATALLKAGEDLLWTSPRGKVVRLARGLRGGKNL